MATDITVPRLGWSMDEGTFGEWLKRDGDFVERGEPLFVLEGEKSAQDIESLERGILRIPPSAPKSGDTVRVGQVLGYLCAEGESLPFHQTTHAKEPAARVAGPAPALPAASARGATAPAAAVATTVKAAISPRARRAAAELGVDAAALRGSGRTGRIRERDVLAAAQHQTGAAPAAAGRGVAAPIAAMRRTIAARMLAGTRDAAPVTLTTRCDATNLVNLREQFRAAAGPEVIVPGYTDFLVKLAAQALVRHPQLRAQWREEGLVVPEGLHIAVAVDTDAGLLAPVVRDVDQLPVRDVAARLRSLAEEARAGRLVPEQMQGGVFTITNLGKFGIDAFTPIINLPQSSILGVGRILREPAVRDGQIVACDLVTLSLTFDHRVVDGAPAARFLQTLSQGIENPAAWLVT